MPNRHFCNLPLQMVGFWRSAEQVNGDNNMPIADATQKSARKEPATHPVLPHRSPLPRGAAGAAPASVHVPTTIRARTDS
jgi:hypothetical protein